MIIIKWTLLQNKWNIQYIFAIQIICMISKILIKYQYKQIILIYFNEMKLKFNNKQNSAQSSIQNYKHSNRYSINRIKQDNQQSKVCIKKTKNNNSFIDLRHNKQNEMSNNSLRQGQKNKKNNAILKNSGQQDFIDKLHLAFKNTKNSNEQYLLQNQKRFQSQLNQKQMIIMEYKNAIRKLQFENKKKDKIIQQYQKQFQNKDKQISNLNAQLITFNSTIQMMKNQSTNSNSMNQNISTEYNNLKKQLTQKAIEIKKHQQALSKAYKDLQIYNSLEPRLKQLEQLQDKLIQQNHKYKQQKEVFVNTFKSINKILKSSQKSMENRQIQCLISGFLL